MLGSMPMAGPRGRMPVRRMRVPGRRCRISSTTLRMPRNVSSALSWSLPKLLVPTQSTTTPGGCLKLSSPLQRRYSKFCVRSPLMPNARASFRGNHRSNTSRRASRASYRSPNCVPRIASVMESPRNSVRQRGLPATPASLASRTKQVCRCSHMSERRSGMEACGRSFSLACEITLETESILLSTSSSSSPLPLLKQWVP
mmetsp:Transcript_11085/g.26981  ORF Transcript_11085/g.26981 Transcript_11085/m.26981 type:complete len:200 (+) Transcript_11085:80-679(+)